VDTNIRKQFDALFGAMYLSESDTARRIFELGYKAGVDHERKWQTLTDDEIMDIAQNGNDGGSFGDLDFQYCTVFFVRAIEAKLKEKNA